MEPHDENATNHIWVGQKMNYAEIDARIMAQYESVPEHIREDICEASKWAKQTLMEHEGAGHEFYITAGAAGVVCCSFAKPSWKGDHCGRGMEHGAQAMVMAVCEYLNGA